MINFDNLIQQNKDNDFCRENLTFIHNLLVEKNFKTDEEEICFLENLKNELYDNSIKLQESGDKQFAAKDLAKSNLIHQILQGETIFC